MFKLRGHGDLVQSCVEVFFCFGWRDVSDGLEQEGRLLSNITVVPLANPIGLSQAVFGTNLGRFDMNSRTNFNRSFPTDLSSNFANTSVVEKLKATLLGLAITADIVLDLHCDDEGPVYFYAPEVMLDRKSVV